MTAVLLDTHALVWLLEGDQHLGHETRRLADIAVREDALRVSAMTFLEVAMLVQRRRLALVQPVANWRHNVLELGIAEIPVSGDIGILATELVDFPLDPADRIIAATAMVHGAQLVTADASILAWKGQLSRHDAHD